VTSCGIWIEQQRVKIQGIQGSTVNNGNIENTQNYICHPEFKN
jgi:hypothetical protein